MTPLSAPRTIDFAGSDHVAILARLAETVLPSRLELDPQDHATVGRS